MRIYEDPQKTSENRKPARSYYIPEGVSEYHLLNGTWDFAYFKRDIDVPDDNPCGVYQRSFALQKKWGRCICV